jgi:hypothetical protein
MKTTETNIYWREIPMGGRVTLGGGSYWYEGQCVYWHGQEASAAQNELNRKIRKK